MNKRILVIELIIFWFICFFESYNCFVDIFGCCLVNFFNVVIIVIMVLSVFLVVLISMLERKID